jgi:hypothetical protein
MFMAKNKVNNYKYKNHLVQSYNHSYLDFKIGV